MSVSKALVSYLLPTPGCFLKTLRRQRCCGDLEKKELRSGERGKSDAMPPHSTWVLSEEYDLHRWIGEAFQVERMDGRGISTAHNWYTKMWQDQNLR